jgi:hypothetical protein
MNWYWMPHEFHPVKNVTKYYFDETRNENVYIYCGAMCMDDFGELVSCHGWNKSMITRNIWGEAFYCENKKKYPLTGWFTPDIKPVREGMYIVGSDRLHWMMKWNGEFWENKNGKPYTMALSWCGWNKPL